MSLQAYKVQDILVFSNKGTEAKLLAAPVIKSMDEWREEADIFALQHLRQGLLLAVEGARATLRNMAEAGR